MVWALSLCIWVGCYFGLFFWMIEKPGRVQGVRLLGVSAGFVGVGSVALSSLAAYEAPGKIAETAEAGVATGLGSFGATAVVLTLCALVPTAAGVSLVLEERPVWLDKLMSLSSRDKWLLCVGIPVLLLSVGWTLIFR